MQLHRLNAALRSSWSRQTSSEPEEWTEANPARDQCDVTGLVVMHYLGGDLLLAPVSAHGEAVGYHYWNQLTATESLDLTLEQFYDEETIGAPELLKRAFILEKLPTARQELRVRYQLLRASVEKYLAGTPVYNSQNEGANSFVQAPAIQTANSSSPTTYRYASVEAPRFTT